jgi:hypothetical protein
MSGNWLGVYKSSSRRIYTTQISYTYSPNAYHTHLYISRSVC